jgi:predicted DNA-binding ArsR family transcriptional regulator
MNDFTKEELKEIKRCLKYMINGGVTPFSNLTMELNKKTQNMIDSYRESECTEIRDANSIESCKKCGKHHE